MAKKICNICTKEIAIYRLDCVNNFISLADAKNGVGLGITTTTVSIVSSKGIDNLIEFIKENKIDMLSGSAFIISGIIIVFLILSILFYANSLIPRNNSTDTQKTKSSPSIKKQNTFYYRHIGNIGRDEFIKITLYQNEKDSIKEILEEVHYNSIICTEKMKNFKHGILCSLVSILLSVIFTIFTMFL